MCHPRSVVFQHSDLQLIATKNKPKSFFREVKLPFETVLSKDTNAPVTSKIVPMRVDDDEGAETMSDPQAHSLPPSIEPQRIVRYETVGGERIEFTPVRSKNACQYER